MQDIIAISKQRIGDDSVNSVSARDLHRELEVKTRFNDWFKRQISKYEFVENRDFTAVTQNRVTAQGNNSKYIDYILTLDMAKELAMVEDNENGRKIRRYFIEIENRYALQISEAKNENLISVTTEQLEKELIAVQFVFDNFNLSKEEKISYTNKFFERTNVVLLENPHLKKLEPVFTLTELLADFQIQIHTSDFNKKLQSFGIIEYSKNGWEIVETRFGENQKFQNSTNPRYYKSTFKEVLDIVLKLEKGEL